MTFAPPTNPNLLAHLRGPESAEGWSRFVRLYTPVLLAWARRLGLGSDDAADLAQDVFVRLLRALPEFDYDPSRRFRAWLWTVLVNRHRERARAQAVRVAGPLVCDVADTAELPAWEEEHRRSLVSRAIRLMRQDFPEQTWRACWEVVVEERPAADVARELGLTANAVYKAKARVLLRLRQELDGLLD